MFAGGLASPLSWAQHWGAGRERVRSPRICALSPAVCLGKGVAPNPSQECEVQIAHSAGGRCAPHFSGLFCWRSSGLRAGPTSQWPPRWTLKQESPHRELAGGCSLGFPVSAKGMSCHVPASHAFLEAASSRSPPGPLSPPRRPARRSPGGWPAGWAAAAPRGDLVSQPC